MLDELMLGGEVQETSKKNVLKAIAAQDLLQEVSAALWWELYQVNSIVNWFNISEAKCIESLSRK